MPKRAADSGIPGTSSENEESPIEGSPVLEITLGEPAAKKFNADVKQEISEVVEPIIVKQERTEEEPDEEVDTDEASRSPLVEDEEEEDDDADSVIEKGDIPPRTEEFSAKCAKANLPEESIVGSWEMYCHAVQRVSLEGSESAWQLAAIYYYFLSKSVKRRGKPIRLLTQPFPVSILIVADAFDVSVMETLDKTVRFVEIIHSRKMRRYLEYLRRVQESLAVSCVIFKKFVLVYREMFVECESQEGVPSSFELFTLLWTSFLILKSRLPFDDLIANYQLLFSMLDQFYSEMCAMKEGVVQHLSQRFVEHLIATDSTIIRALCSRFGGSVLDARHFFNHTFTKLEKIGTPESWNFYEFRDSILSTTRTAYDEYLLYRGCIDERCFIPPEDKFAEMIFHPGRKDTFTDVLTVSRSGVVFKDAAFLNQMANKQCLEKISLSTHRAGLERLSQAREQPRVPFVEFSLELGSYPDDGDSGETSERLKDIIGDWKLETSQLTDVCERMNDNPMATLLLKGDEMMNRFMKRLDEDQKKTEDESTTANKFHELIRDQLGNVFLIFIEKIIVCELQKKVREEDLLNVIRREDFLDSVFCFCMELTLFSNGFLRAFPWSAEVCGIHPFQFHKIIDLMINHEKRLTRAMVQHFNKIEENVIEYYSWKSDSPLWPMVVRCPFTHFQEFGEDWADKLSTYSPMKFTPIKKTGELRDELGRPVVPPTQASKTLRVFLKRTFFTAARRLQELTDRISMGSRAKAQCWSLFDYLLRNEPLVLMDRHLDQILLCCTYVIMKINESQITFNEIMAQYRRQARDASFVYRNVTIFSDQMSNDEESTPGVKVNTKETVLERLEAPAREKQTVNLIVYYNVEFRDRIKYIIGQIDTALDEDLMEMPVPTSYGLMPVRLSVANNVSIQMLPRTPHGNSKQEVAIANLQRTGVLLAINPGSVSVPPVT